MTLSIPAITRLIVLTTPILFGLLSLPAMALKDDQEQPATLDADQFDLDFQTGVRTYRGNVVYQQGSIRLNADEIVAYFKDGQLERAIARGNPARFKQRPDGKDEDVVGVALRIELNELTQFVTLQNNAVVTEGSNTIAGQTISYDLENERVKVRNGGSQKADTAAPTKGNSETDTKNPGKTQASKPKSQPKSTARPRLVIKPRKKKN